MLVIVMNVIQVDLRLIVYVWSAQFLLILSDADSTIHMLTTSENYAVPIGHAMLMECELYATEFNLFDNPIVWRKTQVNESTQVNMMGNLLEPFASTRRLKVTYRQEPPRYLFGLSITSTKREDSGNYSCEISGPQNSILASVTHQLIVKVPIDQIILTTDDKSNAAAAAMMVYSDEQHQQQQQQTLLLMFVERRPVPLGCSAFGGYPPPEIDIYVSSRKVRDDFQVNRTVALSGSKGMRLIYYKTSKWNQYFTAEAEDDGKSIRCIVTVPGLTSNTTSAAASVQHTAIIVCDNVSSHVGARNVPLRCEISAKPPIKNLFWIIDESGKNIKDGDVDDKFRVYRMERTDGIMETELLITQVDASHFHTYILAVENEIGMSTREVLFRQKNEPTLRPLLVKHKTAPIQSSHQNLKSSGLGFLQNDVDATFNHVTTFNGLGTLLTAMCMPYLVLGLR